MHFSTSTLALLSVFGLLTTATPTPAELAPRCGTTLYPSFIQQIKEAHPNTVYPNTLTSSGNFHVQQGFSSGKPNNRVYQIVAFSNIPSGSYACELKVKFPPSYTISSTGNPALNVRTLYKNAQSNIKTPNNWTWKKFFPRKSPPFGQGVFGTISLWPGQDSTINSEGCPAGGGSLAFVFEIADWIERTASVDFKQQVGAGMYLTFNC